MRRALIYLAKLAAFVAIGVWLASNPGDVQIDWLGYRIETSFGFLLFLIAVVLWLVYLAGRTVFSVATAPGAYFERRSGKRRDDGYRALSLGLAAVAAGDGEEARKQAREADRLLRDPELTRLLSAQAAALNGDSAAAARYFAALRDQPETAFVGLTGLIRQAMARGDQAHARDLLEEAYKLRPDSSYVALARLEALTGEGKWAEADDALGEAVKRKMIPEPEGALKRAALLTERAREVAKKDVATALKLLERARTAVANYLPAICFEAELLVADGRPKRAHRLIETAWSSAPSLPLARTYLATFEGEDRLSLFKKLTALSDRTLDHTASRLALAEAALEADLWGEARSHLSALDVARDEGVEPGPMECRLWARLEEAENEDSAAARSWLEKMADAPADEAWTCGECGAVASQWSATCGNCGSLASVDWRRPPRVSFVMAPTLTEGAIDADSGADSGSERPLLETP